MYVKVLLLITIFLLSMVLGCLYSIALNVEKSAVSVYKQHQYQFDIEGDSTIAVYGENGIRYLGIVNIYNTQLDSALIKDNE